MQALLKTQASVAILVAAAICAGCDRDEQVRAYQGSKDVPASAVPAAATAQDQARANAEKLMEWTVPSGWKELPAGKMRYAAFAVSPEHPDMVLTVIRASGSMPANINRWENQLGLPPSPEEQTHEHVKRIEVGGLPAAVVDLLGPENSDDGPRKRMLVAVITQPETQSAWFFKLVGPEPIVSAQKVNFDGFVQSVRFPANSVAMPEPTGATTQDSSSAAHSAPLNGWKVPAGWVEDRATRNDFRVMGFHAGSGPDQAEVAVVLLANRGVGSALDNLNRWRQQVGLAKVTDPSTQHGEKVPVGAGDGLLFDFTGPQNRMVVASLSSGGETWFFKLTGPAAAVAGQRGAFLDFLKSVQFGAGEAGAAGGTGRPDRAPTGQ